MSKHQASREADSPAKKQKTDDSAEAFMKELEQLTLIQDQIEKLNAEADEEKIKIEAKFAEKKKPHIRRRNEVATKIPGFWLSCVSACFRAPIIAARDWSRAPPLVSIPVLA